MSTDCEEEHGAHEFLKVFGELVVHNIGESVFGRGGELVERICEWDRQSRTGLYIVRGKEILNIAGLVNPQFMAGTVTGNADRKEDLRLTTIGDQEALVELINEPSVQQFGVCGSETVVNMDREVNE